MLNLNKFRKRRTTGLHSAAATSGANDVSGPGKTTALENNLRSIGRRLGDGDIATLNSAPQLAVDVIPTGSLALDIALGVGGIPRGRVTEVFGPAACGKTTLALSIIAEAQKNGGTAAFIDMEHALDPAYAQACGVNIEDLLLAQPDCGEQAFNIMETLTSCGAVDLIVVDSAAALVPQAELDGAMGEAQPGLMARRMSQGLRRLIRPLRRSNTALLFTNQLRMRIQASRRQPEITPGGLALKFYAATRLDMRTTQALRQGARIIGNRCQVRVVKNKVAPPFRTAEFDIVYNEGISKLGDLLDTAAEVVIVNKRGAVYSLGERPLACGRANAIAALRQNPKLTAELESRVRKSLLPPLISLGS